MMNPMKYQHELVKLKDEHEEIEETITSMLKSKVINSFAVQALKKKKLFVRQSICRLESMLLGDIVA